MNEMMKDVECVEIPRSCCELGCDPRCHSGEKYGRCECSYDDLLEYAKDFFSTNLNFSDIEAFFAVMKEDLDRFKGKPKFDVDDEISEAIAAVQEAVEEFISEHSINEDEEDECCFLPNLEELTCEPNYCALWEMMNE